MIKVKIKSFANSPSVFIIIIVSVTWALYFQNLDSEFYFDDYSYVINMPNQEYGIDIRSLNNTIDQFTNNYLPGKRLTYITMALNYNVHGLIPTGYRVINVAIHIANGILLLILFHFVVRYLYGIRLDPKLELGLSLVFICHPLAINSVNYVSQRSGLLATFFYLSGFLSYLKFRNSESRKAWSWFFAALLLFWLASQSKSMAITLPLICLAYELISNSQNSKLLWKWFWITIIGGFLFLIATIIYANEINLFASYSLDIGFNAYNLWNPWIHFMTELKVFLYYWVLLVFPIPAWLSISHDIGIATSFWDWQTVSSLAFHLSLLTGAFFLAKKRFYLASFGILWFYLTLSPPYLVLPQREVMVEYKTYLPSIGYCLILSELFLFLQKRQRLKLTYCIASLLVLFLSIITIYRSEVFQSRISLWSDVLKKYPMSSRAYQNRAKAHFDNGQYQRAIQDLEMLVNLHPNFVHGYHNRANIFFHLGKYSEALNDYNDTINLLEKLPLEVQAKYRYALVYYQRGKTALRLGKYEDAVQDFTKFLRWHDDRFGYIERAKAYVHLKGYELAIRDYDHAVELDVKDELAYSNRANVNSLLGHYDKALADYNQALTLNPQHILTYVNRGHLFFKTNHYNRAVEDYKKALQLDPNNRQIKNWLNQSEALLNKGK